MRLVACLIITVALQWGGVAQAEVGDPARAVVRLDMPSGDGSLSTGSAVLIGNGLALTAEHCQLTPDAFVHRPVAASKLFDPQRNGIDEAQLISVAGEWPYEMVIGATPQVGDAVTAYGYPAGKYQEYSGRVVGISDHFITSDIQIDHGASGGGLFNAAGELVGIASAKDVERGVSLWIHTDSIRSAVSQVTDVQRYVRTTRVVVLSLQGCGPCARLKRDVEAGKFPGYAFEWTTLNPHTGQWDNPELHAEFVAECQPQRDPLAPTIWIPGTGKFTEGYETTPGLLGWIEGVIKFIVTGPPARLPIGNTPPPQSTGEPLPTQSGLLDELKSLRDQLETLKGHVDTFQEGGFITKLQGVAVLKDDKQKIEESIASIRGRVEEVKADPVRHGWIIISGLVTGIFHGLIPGRRKGVA